MRGVSVVVGLVVAACAPKGRAAEGAAILWRTDFHQAAIDAQIQKKPLFISVHSESCGPCKEMHRTTLKDPSIVQFANERCIPLLVDGDKNKELMNQWRIAAYPTHMVVGTIGKKPGEVLERVEGKVGVHSMKDLLQRAVRKQSNALVALQNEAAANAAAAAAKTEKPSGSGPIKPPPPTDAESIVKPAAFKGETGEAALGGCCPVCMIDLEQMVPGDKTATAVYQGKKYMFASAEHKRRFLEAPAKFLPALDGDCVVTLVSSGKRVRGDAKFPALYDGKVYFLADKSSRDGFLKEADKFVDAKGEPKTARTANSESGLRR